MVNASSIPQYLQQETVYAITGESFSMIPQPYHGCDYLLESCDQIMLLRACWRVVLIAVLIILIHNGFGHRGKKSNCRVKESERACTASSVSVVSTNKSAKSASASSSSIVSTIAPSLHYSRSIEQGIKSYRRNRAPLNPKP